MAVRPDQPPVPAFRADSSPERLADELLLTLARPRLTQEVCARVRDVLGTHGAGLDWGRFVDLAGRHGVLPLVGRNLIRHRLAQSDEGRPLAPYRWIYSYAYEGNRRRNQALADEYAKVLRAVDDAGIAYAIRKGQPLVDTVYGDPGARRVGDLDLLLRRDTLARVADALTDLGYAQGRQSQNGERIEPFDRRTQLFWRTKLTNVALPFVKLSHRDDVELFIIDPCTSLFQVSSGVEADVGDFLDRRVRRTVYGEPSFVMDRTDQLIDACVQLHVEATTLYYIEIGKDLTLLKFLELAELLRAADEDVAEEFRRRVDVYDCAGSVAWALHHTALLYPDAVPAALADGFPVADAATLDEYGAFDGQVHRWESDFTTRLFDPARNKDVTARSNVPGPRAAV
ncbi:nucleotidyltransferase family protein [Streptomyces sp. SL13]|jgi:hypothetical protein|uniref:Nucleotidyltransferase family protein n=1 Tax=Streptantibioticus silvisoli TaxID=2705255 RepID=A0AA90K9C6_9ACTN|nr:nucleotidyltransferase family protein [Streptantibioticus silvisoli]MDI5970993.1 nucleotidyltransferase family protein [Streptantibioticus silvisoli]